MAKPESSLLDLCFELINLYLNIRQRLYNGLQLGTNSQDDRLFTGAVGFVYQFQQFSSLATFLCNLYHFEFYNFYVKGEGSFCSMPNPAGLIPAVRSTAYNLTKSVPIK